MSEAGVGKRVGDLGVCLPFYATTFMLQHFCLHPTHFPMYNFYPYPYKLEVWLKSTMRARLSPLTL